MSANGLTVISRKLSNGIRDSCHNPTLASFLNEYSPHHKNLEHQLEEDIIVIALLQIIRRSSLEEKVLCLIKKRPGHFCSLSWIIVVSVAWEGLALADSDYLYSELVYKLNENGIATNRRCAANEQRTCACQVKFNKNKTKKIKS